MVFLTSLWLPILLSAVLVFLASFVIHMVLPFHRSDYGKVPSEDDVMSALRKFGIAPGDYFLPHASGPAEMKTPEYKKKVELGPIVVMTVMGPGAYAMGKRLLQWFLFTVVVGVFAGYIAGRTLAFGTPYIMVFRIVGTVAFAGYAVGLWQNSIWYSKKWSATVKSTVDGLVYALLTAGTFGWLWPR
jgi:uncharacterized membrane protein YeaQ/YmgE (transglycosylase-associated protein family)